MLVRELIQDLISRNTVDVKTYENKWRTEIITGKLLHQWTDELAEFLIPGRYEKRKCPKGFHLLSPTLRLLRRWTALGIFPLPFLLLTLWVHPFVSAQGNSLLSCPKGCQGWPGPSPPVASPHTFVRRVEHQMDSKTYVLSLFGCLTFKWSFPWTQPSEGRDRARVQGHAPAPWLLSYSPAQTSDRRTGCYSLRSPFQAYRVWHKRWLWYSKAGFASNWKCKCPFGFKTQEICGFFLCPSL